GDVDSHTRENVCEPDASVIFSLLHERPEGHVVSLQHSSTHTPRLTSQNSPAHCAFDVHAAPARRPPLPACCATHIGTLSTPPFGPGACTPFSTEHISPDAQSA